MTLIANIMVVFVIFILCIDLNIFYIGAGEPLPLRFWEKVKCFPGRGLNEKDLFKPCCRAGNDRISGCSIRMRYLHS